ncbi:ABC transporter permease [Robertmurraya sp. FSL R5-0851]|uniref:ABC transporter permease n=1 Tax=Robertmurraya sp. FSL R5-0851 TaxID=2921584 RepID=UPI0030FB6D67
MNSNIWFQIIDYFNGNFETFLIALREHLEISILTLIIAMMIGIPGGYLCAKHRFMEKYFISIFQVLRIIPSLAILFLFVPIIGTGIKPAIIALTLLAIPPILMNTIVGIKEVPGFMLETAHGLGMSNKQVLRRVTFPLAMPLILAGVKMAMIEVIASPTLAAKIGAGGLGGIIFTGLGLNRMDLLIVGGVSVGMVSILAGVFLDIIERSLLKFKYVK